MTGKNLPRARGVGAAVSLGTKWRSENVRHPNCDTGEGRHKEETTHVSARNVMEEWFRRRVVEAVEKWENKNLLRAQASFYGLFFHAMPNGVAVGAYANTHARDIRQTTHTLTR